MQAFAIVILGGLLLLGVLFVGAIFTILLPILLLLLAIAGALYGIYSFLLIGNPEVLEKTAEVAREAMSMFC